MVTITTVSNGPETGNIIGVNQVGELSIQQYLVSQTFGSSYYWSVINGAIATGQGTNVVTVQWGNAGQSQISVLETDEYGCVGSEVSFNVLVGPTGILTPAKEYLVKVYPNPTNGGFKIEIDGYNGGFEAEIFDITGRSLNRSNGLNMSLENYPNGLYFLRVYYDNKFQDIRLIKN